MGKRPPSDAEAFQNAVREPSPLDGVELAWLNKVGWASPTQWDAFTHDGTYYYIRYHFSELSVAKNGVLNTIWEKALGRNFWHGAMDTSEMLQLTGFKISPKHPSEQLKEYIRHYLHRQQPF